MDIAELAARLAEKSNKPGGAKAAAQAPDARNEGKAATGKAPKQRSAERGASLAKKAAAGRRSVPRTSGK